MVWAVSLSTTELIPHSLTPRFWLMAFVVWLGLEDTLPLVHPEPYLHWLSSEAAPQCISGRTSYHRVRLAFHLYPQLILQLCNADQFGPPPRFYRGFTLAMDSSPGFGSNPRDIIALFRLAFASAARRKSLNQPRRLTRRLILQ